VAPPPPLVEAVVDEGLGHSSYVVDLGDGTALVVDPARFPAEQRRLAAARGWRIAWTADTHSHADYVSGSPELAAAGAVFLASAGARLEVPHRPVTAGEAIELATGVVLRAIATPGHTPDHLAYLLSHGDQPVALFSGGSLMVGAVGRTDLLGDERRDELARRLHRALRGDVLTLPLDLPVYPTHGAGSFCSAPAGGDRVTTIGRELETNPLLSVEDEDEFVATLLGGLGTFPTYFRQLPERNRRGPRVFDALPPLEPLELAEVDDAVEAGAVVVDARPMAAFAEAHLPASLSIALRPVFGSWLGWLLDLDRPVVFVTDGTVDRAELVRQALVVGHDAVVGEIRGGLDAWRAAGRPTASLPLVETADPDALVVDVRQRSEWQAGHVPGAVHLELGSIRAPLRTDEAITVMCGHGERAMTAASLLARLGQPRLSVFAGGPEGWARALHLRLVGDP
jgi:glyoxylase-like metal-dependent hydrolase (beta-lactamase superfamily II)/rhodanese-related sulfurtransferase